MATVGEDRTTAIETLEKDIVAKKKELAELRRTQPRQALPKYTFAQDETLVDLFNGRDELLILHNMGKGCRFCTLWADGLIGFYPHIVDRCAFVLVSPDDPATQKEFAESRGWPFRMVSDAARAFTKDMGMWKPYEDGKEGPWPGISSFKRQADGFIVRVAQADLGEGDDFCAIWHLFDLLEAGPNGWEPQYSY